MNLPARDELSVPRNQAIVSPQLPTDSKGEGSMAGGNKLKMNRRAVFKSLAALGASSAAFDHSSAGSTPSIRDRFGARFVDHSELTIALLNTDQLAIQPLLDEYKTLTGTTINTVVDSYNDIYTKISISLTQSTGAFDIVSLDDPWMPQFAGGEFLIDLAELMEKDGIKTDPDFLLPFLNLGEYPVGSGLRAIPWIGNVQLLAWRTDIFEQLGAEVPQNWDDLLAVVSRITAERSAEGTYGFGMQGRTGNPAATTFLPVLRGFGKDLLDPVTNEPQLATGASIAAMEMLIALRTQSPPGVDKTGHSENGSNLLSGAIAVSADIWPDQLFRSFNPSVSSVTGLIGIGAEPAEGRLRPANVTGSWLLGVASGSKNAERAAEFVYWFTSARQQKRLLLEFGISPTRSSVFADRGAIEQLPLLPDVLAAIKRSKPRLRTPYYRALEEICGGYVAEALTGRISAEDAMTGAHDDIESLLIREGVLN